MPKRCMHSHVVLVVAIVAAQCSPCWAWFWSKKKVSVWVDDARTVKVTVPKLDADQIAERTSKRLKLSLGYSGFGIGVDWSRKKGLEYGGKAKVLIAKLKQLCLEFNRGRLSLETYRRRLCEIYAAEEKARDVRTRLFLLNRQQASKAFIAMDKELGLPATVVQQSEQQIGALLADLKRSIDGIPHRGPVSPMARPAGTRGTAKTTWAETVEEDRAAVVAGLADMTKQTAAAAGRRLKPSEIIEVWKDDARTKRVKARKLDCERIVQDVESTMSVGAKFWIWDIGPKAKWTLSKKATYNKTAQLLILKYRQLCVEYNAGLVSQESYARRVRELHAAEEKARHARYELFALLREQAKEAFADLDEVMAKAGEERSKEEHDLEDIANQMSKKAWDKTGKGRRRPSFVKKISSENQKRIVESSLSEFQKSVAGIKIKPKDETIEVWADDAKTRKVTVPKLDATQLAQSVKSRFSLHLTYYSFGPEIAWAKITGISYDAAVQMLTVKYKQLIMDYNAGLVTQESYQRRRREIDVAAEKAGRVREAMFRFMRKLSKEAFAELDSQAALFRGR